MNQKTDFSQSIHAAFLCRAAPSDIAFEVGVSPSRVEAWRSGTPVPEEHRESVRLLAMNLVLHEIERVGRAVVEQPNAVLGEAFRAYLNDLNLAHWLVFGQSFLRYLEQWELEKLERSQ